MAVFHDIYNNLIVKNDLSCYLDKVESFYILYKALIRANNNLNLTAIDTPESIIIRHFIDCLKIVSYIPQGSYLLDVGCGGGFPSLPVAIVRKDVSIVSLDATAKKLGFVDDMSSILNLENITTITGRAELLSRTGVYRNQFDVVVSRAVARLNILSELCMPFLKTNGIFISMKAASAIEEIDEAQLGIKILGGNIISRDKFLLSDGSIRENIIIKKITDTPDKYPRSFSKIKKMPL